MGCHLLTLQGCWVKAVRMFPMTLLEMKIARKNRENDFWENCDLRRELSVLGGECRGRWDGWDAWKIEDALPFGWANGTYDSNSNGSIKSSELEAPTFVRLGNSQGLGGLGPVISLEITFWWPSSFNGGMSHLQISWHQWHWGTHGLKIRGEDVHDIFGMHFFIWVFPKIGVYTPKSSILIEFSLINHPFWGFSPYFWKHPYVFWLRTEPWSQGLADLSRSSQTVKDHQPFKAVDP